MLIAIRVDASLKMGTGHIFRMLTLAKQLERKGHEVVFVCRKLKGNLIAFVREDFPVIELAAPDDQVECSNTHCNHGSWLEVDYESEIDQSRNALIEFLSDRAESKFDWLIIDHYAIEKQYQIGLKSTYCFVMQVDDLADREHCVDLLLDQNYYCLGESRYDDLVLSPTIRLCGPQYALLRDEFSLTRSHLSPYQHRLEQGRVVLFFGGIDIANETMKALQGLLRVESTDHFDVIIGSNNPNKEQLQDFCVINADRVSLYIQVSNMMDYFAASYLYVGAVGATTWERCVLALPGLVCSVAHNQTQLAEDLNEINGHCYLGLNGQLTPDDYENAYRQLLTNVQPLVKQSEQCFQLVDGLGCERVVRQLEEISNYDQF